MSDQTTVEPEVPLRKSAIVSGFFLGLLFLYVVHLLNVFASAVNYPNLLPPAWLISAYLGAFLGTIISDLFDRNGALTFFRVKDLKLEDWAWAIARMTLGVATPALIFQGDFSTWNCFAVATFGAIFPMEILKLLKVLTAKLKV
ncbi:hypothetical protein [Limimaricola cinnabarinus]|uniref:hypothetical protein n=1 Tax=Limimaricola cinnabarinus TaxID=1125964 RepID=UPI0024912BF2|nr:hypothetical protein [Limimaricola cinnabarinus]